MMAVLGALGWLLLTLLKIVGILLLILLVLLALALLCPFCADFCWENGVVTIRAGVPGITLPVFRWPAPPPAEPEEPKGFFGKLKAKLRASRAERRRKKAAERAAKEAKKPKKKTPPRKKAKLTLNILVTILRGGRAADEGRLWLPAGHEDPGLPRRPGRGPRRSRPRLRQAECVALPVSRRHRPLRLPRLRGAAHPAGFRLCRADGGRPRLVPPQRPAAVHRRSGGAGPV